MRLAGRRYTSQTTHTIQALNTRILHTIALAALLLSAPSPLRAQYRTSWTDPTLSDTQAALSGHVGYIASAAMEGRKAGSEGEKATAEYVREVMQSYGVEVLSPKSGDTFGISRTPGDTLLSRNVVGVVQGHDKALFGRYIVVAARMDNLGTHTLTVDGEPVLQTYYGANGNASGLAMLLELSRMAASNSTLLRRSIVFVALGASCETFAGAWYFLNRSFPEPDKIDAAVNLDMLGIGNEFYAYAASNADLGRLLAKVSGTLQPLVPKVTTQEPYSSDHRAFYSAKVPCVFFTSGQYVEHGTPRDTPGILDYQGMERKLEYIYSFIRALSDVQDAPAFTPADVKRDEIGSRTYHYTECDEYPSFMRRTDPRYFLTSWVYAYIKYPPTALRDGVQGQVQVRFYIEKDGSVKDAEVVKSVSPALDEEALKVVLASPKWRPGKVKGVKVRTSVTIPVDFRLEKKTGKPSFGIKM